MSELAGSALQLAAEDVLPAVINAFAWISDNGQTVATVIGTVAAGIAAYKIAAEGAAIAQTAFNAAMNINPFFLLASAAAAATFAIVKFTKEAEKNFEIRNQLDETTQAVLDQKNAFEETLASAREYSKEIDKNTESAKYYWNEIKRLSDENGNATVSATALEAAVTLLNETAGTNIEVINGQIQGYKELSATMDDYIEHTSREAKMSGLKDSYVEAVTNIENANKEYEQALAERNAVFEDYKKKQEVLRLMDERGYSVDKPADQVREEAEAAGNALSEAGIRLGALSQQRQNYMSVIKEYNSLLNENSGQSEKTLQQLDAENYAAKNKKTLERTAEETVQVQEDISEKLKRSWKQLEHDYAIGAIKTESELYDKKKELWNEYGDASLKEHWSYLEDIAGYDKDFAEDRQKAAEETAKERLNLEEEENQKAEEKRKKSIEEQEDIVEDGLGKILKAYQNAYDELDKRREAYRQKLLSVGGDLFSVNEIENPDGTKTTEYAVNNVDEQLRKMREYHRQIKALKATPNSDGLLAELTSLNDEDSMQFAKYLSGMSASEFAKINELYNEKQRLADELANDLYKDEAQSISESMTGALADLAVSSYEYGAQSAKEFSKGFTEAMGELGMSSLYNQAQASGANQTYQNYFTASEAEPQFTAKISPGKTVIMLDGKVVGEATTEYQTDQKRIKST